MSVYVDDMARPFHHMVMCHMMADSRAELDRMAARLGLHRYWRQASGTYQEHYDLSVRARRDALRFGALPLTQKELVAKMWAKRDAAAMEAE